MEARATQKHIRVSPQKARLVVDLIRGKNAGDALSILAFTKKRVTQAVEKVLRSAIANAEDKAEHVDVDRLVVSQAYVNEGIAHQASSSCSHGPGLPLSAANLPRYGGGGRQRIGREGRRVKAAISQEEWMGQKVHPYGFRLGYNKTWKSRWFAKKDYSDFLHEDLKLKKRLKDQLQAAGVASIEVERPGNKLKITIHTARPGIIIGRKGAEIDRLRQEIQKRTGREVLPINIQEVHRPELNAQLVAEAICLQLEKRVAFRRAMRKAVDSALRFGCKGIKIRCGGRLNGAEIARSEWYLQGRLPLHTLRADIDYGLAQAMTTYGVIGVKCWIYNGEILSRRSGR